MALIPQMVKTNDLHIANSLVTTTGMLALVFGALVGGYIVEYGGAKGGFIWDASTFFISGMLVLSITSVRRMRINGQGFVRNTKEMVRVQKTVWAEIIEGVRYISHQQQIRFIFIMMSVLFAAAGAIYVVAIVFIQQAFHSVTKDLGFLAVPLGLGLLAGSLLYGKWGGKFSKFRIMFLSLILGGLLIAVFAALVAGTHNRNLAVALVFILGLVSGPVVIASNTVLHQVCDSQMSGKVFAALEFVMHLAFLVAMLATSLIAETCPRVWILITVGVIFTLIGFIGLIKCRKWKGME
jgi:MFS family permease